MLNRFFSVALACGLSVLPFARPSQAATEFIRVEPVRAELCGAVEKQESEKAPAFSLNAFYSHKGNTYCAIKVFKRTPNVTREQFWVESDKAIEAQWKQLGYTIERKSLLLNRRDTTISTSVIGSRSYLEGRDRQGKPTAIIVIHDRDVAIMLDVSVFNGTFAQARSAVEQMETSLQIK